MRLAILADIHGNLPAFEAVMVELNASQPDVVIVDGDLINAVPFSGSVVDTIRAQDWLVVRGNHEFYYLNFDTERDVAGSDDADRWGQIALVGGAPDARPGSVLAALPDDPRPFFPWTRPLRVAHGVPGHNRRGFARKQPDEEIVTAVQAGSMTNPDHGAHPCPARPASAPDGATTATTPILTAIRKDGSATTGVGASSILAALAFR